MPPKRALTVTACLASRTGRGVMLHILCQFHDMFQGAMSLAAVLSIYPINQVEITDYFQKHPCFIQTSRFLTIFKIHSLVDAYMISPVPSLRA